MMNDHAYQLLEELSDQIGGRVTGSPQAQQAIDWGVEKMKAMGLENVHVEKWQMSHGWKRISAEAELEAPIQRRLKVDSMGWVGSTVPGGAEAEVVPVNINQLDKEMKDNTSKWAGKVLLIVRKGEAPSDPVATFTKFGPFLKAAYDAHAVAVIGGQGGSEAEGMNITHTGGMGFGTVYDIAVVSMVMEDQEQIQRFVDQGKTVRVKINVQNQFSGPMESANVVGEIRGREHPEQLIVVGAHLDSWDLAEGATDDGMGVAVTLGAAEAILHSGQKPRRTVRFVLFTGEEQGHLGSMAYVKDHKDEIQNHVAAIVMDSGAGQTVRLNIGGRKDLIPAVKSFTESVVAFGPLAVTDNPSFGTDSGSFTLAGLPCINVHNDSPDYRYIIHSPVDTFDKIKPEFVLRDATVMALTAYWIADRPERLATPLSPEQTARMLVEKKQDLFLKTFGMWPFGDLGKEEPKK
jgi:hypothetical protein